MFINTSFGVNLPAYYLVYTAFNLSDQSYNESDPAPLIKQYLGELDFASIKVGIGYLF